MSANSSVVKGWTKRTLIGVPILVGLILGVLMIAPRPAETQSAVTVSGDEESLRRGIDASAARWTALGVYYAPDYEAIATVNAARWTALAQHFDAESRGRVADAARWNALGARYTAQEKQDLQRGIDASAARYSAIAQYHAAAGVTR